MLLSLPLSSSELSAMVRSGTQWVFVTSEGIGFISDAPLGAFHAFRPTLEPFRDVKGENGLLLGLRSNGTLLESLDAGLSWQPAPLATPPPGPHVVGVAVSPDGSALALGAPEQLWWGPALAQNWRLLAIPPVGASRIKAEDQKFMVEGALSTFAVEAGGTFHAVQVPQPVAHIEPSRVALEKPPAASRTRETGR